MECEKMYPVRKNVKEFFLSSYQKAQTKALESQHGQILSL